MQINFAEVEGGFDNLPKGLYPAVVEKVEVRESKSSEHNYLNWEWTITEGEFEGRKQWQITSLSPKAFFRLKDQFEALGFDVEVEDFDIEWDEDVVITPEAGPLLVNPDVVGMQGLLVVTMDTWEGKERNKVDEVRPFEDDATPTKQPGSSAKKASAPKQKVGAGGRRALR